MTTSLAVDPSTLASLHPSMGLELRYKTYKNAQRTWGSHLLSLKQVSRVPESSRKYQQGDPINLIDWKAFARTDQLLVREVRDEASAKIAIVLDLSESTLWPTKENTMTPKGVPQKAEIITRIGIHLAFIFLSVGDFVDIWLIESENRNTPHYKYTPRSGPDLLGVFEELLTKPNEIPTAFEVSEGFSRTRDAGFWVGDGLGQGDFAYFQSNMKKSFFVHVLSSLETNVDWMDNDANYFDSSTELKEYRGTELTKEMQYKNQIDNWLAKTKERTEKLGSYYLNVTDSTSIGQYAGFLEAITKYKGA